MPTIQKRGSSYQITASVGYARSGRQIRRTMTWTPPPGMSSAQADREAQRQAYRFEDQVQSGQTAADGSIRLEDFTQIFLDRHGVNLKAKTRYDYQTAMEVLNRYIGRYKLSELKPGHIAALYTQLQREGVREREMALPIGDFKAIMDERKLNMVKLTKLSGVSNWSLRQCKKGEAIASGAAEKIAQALELPMESLFRIERDTRPLAPGTIHVYHRALSAVLSKAVKWGNIPTNPAAGADLPSIARRRAKYLDEPDARRLLELLQAEPIKWRALVTFDLLSGLRRAELLGLRWCDVDFGHQLLHIRQTWNYLPGEGCYLDTPKTPDGERPLKLSRTAMQLLTELQVWQAHQAEILGDVWQNEDDRIFTAEDGKPLFPDSITNWFTAFVRRSGLPEVTVHSLRHTYASLMIADNTPLVVVAHSLGHAQVSTTSNIYAHVIADAEAKATEVYDKFADVVPRIRTSTTNSDGEKGAAG